VRIYAAYMPHICRIFRQNATYFTAFLAGELPAYFPKKSRYKPVSLNGVNTAPVNSRAVFQQQGGYGLAMLLYSSYSMIE